MCESSNSLGMSDLPYVEDQWIVGRVPDFPNYEKKFLSKPLQAKNRQYLIIFQNTVANRK